MQKENKVLDFHASAAEEYGKIRTELESQGRPIGLMMEDWTRD